MNEQNNSAQRRIRRALISVSDKTGLLEFAGVLRDFGVEIISTGGTATALRNAGIEVRDVSQITGFPEMMGGRIKTLHPRVHGALLALRDNPEHTAAMTAHGIKPIDLVVVNLYPFQETVSRPGVAIDEAVEQIDIGGPAMIRSAAKNYRDVAVVVSPDNYQGIIEELRSNEGSLSQKTRRQLAIAAFARTSEYDAAIASYLETGFEPASDNQQQEAGDKSFPDRIELQLTKASDLRYGENPHQRAALYNFGQKAGVASAELVGGKEMSFNNYVDADAAWDLVNEFELPACAIIKHTNPAGVATGVSLTEAYRKALETDPVSAFGGIVAFNREVDLDAARAVIEIFTEVVVAPAFSEAAIEQLRSKKNLRILRVNPGHGETDLVYSTISGGMLIQTADTAQVHENSLKVVSEREPTPEEIQAMLFAWKVCKHTKSNAIVYAVAGQTIGVGAGQMSRVDSVRLGALRARIPVAGSVLASDAFFPFRDNIDEAAKHGITAVIQPGGSVRDDEVIGAANEHKLAMVFTGIRHFRH
jgi:phosphoribosylaminoimidazolecarboxamide formyltransferase/IMP cyclohydrolase